MGRKEEAKIGTERVKILLEEAQKAANLERSRRYVKLARKVAARIRLRLSPTTKRKFCKYCNAYFIQGKNCRVRTRKGLIVVTCLQCGKQMRHRLKKAHSSAA